MKFNSSDLLKLGLGAGAGYVGASLLMPHRGFAASGCPWDCHHLNDEQATSQACVDKCGPGLRPWTQAALNRRSAWEKLTAANPQTPDRSDIIYPSGSPAGIAGGAARQAAGDAWKSTTDAFNSSLQWLEHNVGMPVLLIGGAVLLLVLVSKR